MALPSRLLRRALAMAALGASATAIAAPLSLVGPPGAVQVGSMVAFTVTDENPLGGYSVANDAYLVDFSLFYDAGTLQYLHTQATSPDYLLIVPNLGAGDADPAGLLFGQLIVSGAPANSPLSLFTVYFEALATAPGTGTELMLFFPSNGAYGDVNTAVTTPFEPSFTRTTITAVPEAQTWAMALAGGLIAAATLRRRSVR